MLMEEATTSTYQQFRNVGLIKPKLAAGELDLISLDLAPEITDPRVSAAIVMPPRELPNQVLTIAELRRRFKILFEIDQTLLSTEEKLIIALYKLSIMQAVKLNLQQKYEKKKPKVEEESSPVKFPVLRRIAYVGVLIVALIQDAVGSFFSGYALLSLIFGVITPLLIIGAIAFSLLNVALLYSLKTVDLQHTLGVYSKEKNPLSLLKTHEDQISATKKIDEMLFDSITGEEISLRNYQGYAGITQDFQKDLTNKQSLLNKYHESTVKKIFRWMVAGFSAFMALSGSYFIATTLLGAVAASLVGTPLGWVIIGASLLSSLVFYLAQPTGIVSLFNPDYEQFKIVSKKLKKFKGREPEEFETVIKNKIEKESLVTRVEEKHQNSRRLARTQSAPLASEFAQIAPPRLRRTQAVDPHVNNQPPRSPSLH